MVFLIIFLMSSDDEERDYTDDEEEYEEEVRLSTYLINLWLEINGHLSFKILSLPNCQLMKFFSPISGGI